MSQMDRMVWNNVYRVISVCMSVLLLLQGPVLTVNATNETNEIEEEPVTETIVRKEPVYIRTAQELLTFAQNCKVADYSDHLEVYLEDDIRLEELQDGDFAGITSFSGAFEGNGHTISGLKLTGGSEAVGLFRYIEEGALVHNLTVTGSISSSSAQNKIGGIAGINAGTIRNCTFSGSITGVGVTGGIVGLNGARGAVVKCCAQGKISSLHTVGGIAGQNRGSISDCINTAYVNAETDWLDLESDTELSVSLPGVLDAVQEELADGTDFGGIAGWNDGIIAGCENQSVVGYRHTGKNVGGIVGRQSGEVILCTNSGRVYGKQDVGGIVGQLEPRIAYEDMEELDQKVDELHDLMNRMVDDMEAMGDALHKDFKDLNQESSAAGDTATLLLDEMRDVLEKDVAVINDFINRVDYAMTHFAVVTRHLNNALDTADLMLADLQKVKQDLSIRDQMEEEDYEEAKKKRLVLKAGIGGSIRADNENPAEGAGVKITVDTQKGYRLSALTQKPYGGEETEITERTEDGQYVIPAMPKENLTVQASFVYAGGYYLLQSNAGGTAVLSEDQGSMKIYPENGYRCSDILIDGEKYDHTEEGEEIALPAPAENTVQTITVVFAPEAELPADGSGNIRTIGSVGGHVQADKRQAEGGETLQLLIINDPGYVLKTLTVCGGENLADRVTNNGCTVTLPETLSGDVEILAEFCPVYLILQSIGVGGQVSYRVSERDVLFTVQPDRGYAVRSICIRDRMQQDISYQKEYADAEIYRFAADTLQGDYGYLTVEFSTQTDKETVDHAKEDLQNQTDDVVSGVNRISDVSDRVKVLLTDEYGETKKPQDLTPEEMDELRALIAELLGAVSETGASAGAVLGDANTVIKVTSPYLDEAMENASRDLDQLAEDAGAMNDALQGAGRELQSILDYLNALNRLQAAHLSGDFDKNAERLKLELDTISILLGRLDDHTYYHSEKLEDDMRLVNDKLNEVFQLLIEKLDHMENLVNGEDKIEDRSAEEEGSENAARIVNSSNTGIVNGDWNVGGIAGCVGIEERKKEERISVGNQYTARARISGCENSGFITLKNENAGGIAGKLELGYVTACEGSGRVQSESGSFLGGIAGYSSGMIHACSAAAILSGNQYIGGIAGLAEKISHCYAMPTLLKGEGFLGAIAGQDSADVEKEKDITLVRGALRSRMQENYYVSSKLYGINGVSYVGAAEPIAYRDLLTREDAPSLFRHLTVTFIDEDENVMQQTPFLYGANLSDLSYPQVVTERGDYLEWEGFDGDILEGNIVIQAVETANVTTLSSDRKVNEKPVVLVSGMFTKSAYVQAEEYQGTLPLELPEGAICHAYHLTLENTDLEDSAVTRIRLYHAEKGNTEVYRLKGDQWEKTEKKTLGSYEEVKMVGTDAVFCVVITEKEVELFWIGIAATTVCLSGAGILVIGHRRRKIKGRSE